MFEDLFFGHDVVGHHVATVFAPIKDLVPGLGLDPPEGATVLPTAAMNNGPVEYIFKISTAVGGKDENGVYMDNGAQKSTPRIQFVGNATQSEIVPIKPGMNSGKLYEFSATAKDVGPVKAIRLSDPHGNALWKPDSVSVNRLPSFGGGKDAPLMKPDGWVTFSVNKPIGSNPVTISVDNPKPDVPDSTTTA